MTATGKYGLPETARQKSRLFSQALKRKRHRIAQGDAHRFAVVHTSILMHGNRRARRFHILRKPLLHRRRYINIPLSEAELDARAWQIEHHGEEMGYVLEGEIELALGEQTYTLTAGD